MKRVIALLLATVMCLSLAACSGGNKKAFDLSESAFNNIQEAYEMLDVIGNDILTAWKLGVYNKEELLTWKEGFDYLTSNLSIGRDDLITALASLVYGMTDSWCVELAEEYYDSMFNGSVDGLVTVAFPDVFSGCVTLVLEAYRLNGELAVAELLLHSAGESIKELSEKHSSYEHYEYVKKYFTAANTYYNFCSNPTGTLEQVMENINSYNQTAAECYNSLYYFFEK